MTGLVRGWGPGFPHPSKYLINVDCMGRSEAGQFSVFGAVEENKRLEVNRAALSQLLYLSRGDTYPIEPLDTSRDCERNSSDRELQAQVRQDQA
jgi:hypothetical protein